jgi:hypothetical protein
LTYTATFRLATADPATIRIQRAVSFRRPALGARPGLPPWPAWTGRGARAPFTLPARDRPQRASLGPRGACEQKSAVGLLAAKPTASNKPHRPVQLRGENTSASQRMWVITSL